MERKTEKKSNLKKGIIVALIILAALILGSHYILTYFVNTRIAGSMNQQQQTEMDRFFDEPADFPVEWLSVQPYSKELQEASEKVVREWALIEEKTLNSSIFKRSKGGRSPFGNLLAGNQLTEVQRNEMERLIRETASFTAIVSDLTARPDYEIEAFPTSMDGQYPNFQMIREAGRLKAAEAILLANRGREKEALEKAVDALRISKRHPASTLISHLIAISIENTGSKSLAIVLDKCNDPELLRETLRELNKISITLEEIKLDNVFLVDMMGAIRYLKREGYPINVIEGKPAVYYFKKAMIADDDFPKWKLDQLDKDDPDYGKYEKRASRKREFFPYVALSLTFYRPLGELIYSIARPNFDQAHIRLKAAEARFNLVRLKLAAKITELERNENIRKIEDISAGLLPEIPDDPFSDKPFRESAGELYSIGPDEKNDNNTFAYDPTNGTTSKGDISLP